jgi:hypothetical protein
MNLQEVGHQQESTCLCPADDMAEWVRREYKKGDIDRAGAILSEWWGQPLQPGVDESVSEDRQKLTEAWLITQNWRTSHAYPLNAFQITLKARARRVEPGVLVAQRLKRMPSVLRKLIRQKDMKLSQMQDLGGCRAILSDIKAVDALFAMYRQRDRLLFEPADGLKCYDYLRNPKPDGYRGIHIVGRFSARVAGRQDWNGHRIEIQLRSRLQHAYATAVETVTTFTREQLKFGGGAENWRRFFALMGSALALREGTAPVSGTPSSEAELIKELRELTSALRVRQRLSGWSRALRSVPNRSVGSSKWLMLVLDLDASTIRVKGFADRQKGAEAVGELEKQNSPNIDTVLVFVGSASNLKKAYPNYYADTTEFIGALDHALRGRS